MASIRAALGVKETTFSAMKKAMGLSGNRMGFLSKFSEFIKDNPGFKQTDVYHRPGCVCGACAQKNAEAVNLAPGIRKRGRPRLVAVGSV